MAKTIDKNVLFKRMAKKISPPPKNLSEKEIYASFCEKYGEAIAPGLEEIDRWQARSQRGMFTKYVGGVYYLN